MRTRRLMLLLASVAVACCMLSAPGCSGAALKTTSGMTPLSQHYGILAKQKIVTYCQTCMMEDDALVSTGRFWLVDEAMPSTATEKGIRIDIITGAKLAASAAAGRTGTLAIAVAATSPSEASTTASAATTTASTTASTTATTTASSTASAATGDSGSTAGENTSSGEATDNGGTAGEKTSSGGSASNKIQVTVIIDSSAAASYGKGFGTSTYDISLESGKSAFDALWDAVGNGNGIDYRTDVAYGIYVIGINGLSEFDCGSESGWKYKIDNGDPPGVGAGNYQLTTSCTVTWFYDTSV